MDKLEVFINLDYQKISLIIIDIKNKKKIKFTEFEVLNDFNNIDTILDNLNKILKGLIIDLEKSLLLSETIMFSGFLSYAITPI